MKIRKWIDFYLPLPAKQGAWVDNLNGNRLLFSLHRINYIQSITSSAAISKAIKSIHTDFLEQMQISSIVSKSIDLRKFNRLQHSKHNFQDILGKSTNDFINYFIHITLFSPAYFWYERLLSPTGQNQSNCSL